MKAGVRLWLIVKAYMVKPWRHGGFCRLLRDARNIRKQCTRDLDPFLFYEEISLFHGRI